MRSNSWLRAFDASLDSGCPEIHLNHTEARKKPIQVVLGKACETQGLNFRKHLLSLAVRSLPFLRNENQLSPLVLRILLSSDVADPLHPRQCLTHGCCLEVIRVRKLFLTLSIFPEKRVKNPWLPRRNVV